MEKVRPQEMAALVLTGKGRMEVLDVPVPGLENGEVLIRVTAAGICGSELGGFLGTNALRTPPLIMGHEAMGELVEGAGEILADGSPAQGGAMVTFNPLVTCGRCEFCRRERTNLCAERKLVGIHRPGAFAEFVAVPAAQCWPLAGKPEAALGVMVEPLACAVRAVKRARLEQSEELAVLGAGPIGLCCLLAATRTNGNRARVVEPNGRRRRLAEQWGAGELLEPGEKVTERVDVIIDAVGSRASLREAFERVRPGGRIVVLGLHDEEGPLPVGALVRGEIQVTGSFGYVMKDFAEALDLAARVLPCPEEGWLEIRNLRSGGAAFEELVSGRFGKAKIVLVP